MSSQQQSLSQSIIIGSLAGLLVGGMSAVVQKDWKPALMLGGVTGVTTGAAYQIIERKQKSAPKNQIAVFWDYENVKIPSQGGQDQTQQRLHKIIKYIETKGNPAIKNVYSKWGKENTITQAVIDNQGFDLVHVSSQEKNSVDFRLVVDCLSTVYRLPHINKFIIFTNDNDYVELVNTLRKLNKEVIIIGHKNTTGQLLRDNADDSIAIESLLEIEVPKPPTIKSPANPPQLSYEVAVKYLVDLVKNCQDSQQPILLCQVDKVMRDRHQDYQGFKTIAPPKNQKFSNFSNFLKQAEKDGFIQIKKQSKDAKKSQDIVTLPQANPSTPKTAVPKQPQQAKAKIPYDRGVNLLIQAIKQLNCEQKKATINNIVGKLEKLSPLYQNSKSIQRTNGVNFGSLTKFIEQVEKDGKVKVQRPQNSKKIKEVKLVETPTLELLPSPVRESA